MVGGVSHLGFHNEDENIKYFFKVADRTILVKHFVGVVINQLTFVFQQISIF